MRETRRDRLTTFVDIEMYVGMQCTLYVNLLKYHIPSASHDSSSIAESR